MRKFRKIKFFTLVELLVSLGIFSVLLVVFMQLFNNFSKVVTNSEARTANTIDVRNTMDLCSTLLSTLFYSTANTEASEKGYFPFAIVTGTPSDQLYFATKAQIDLAGSSPIRYVGLMVPSRSASLGTTGTAFCDKLFLTVLSNKEGSNNADIYRQLFPQFVNASNDLVPLSTAVGTLTNNLRTKLTDNSNPATDTDNRIKLLDNVVEFKVRLLKADGTPESGTVITSQTRQIEIIISVLEEKEYKEWVAMWGTQTSEPSAAQTFRISAQTTFRRRIYVVDHSLLEDSYE